MTCRKRALRMCNKTCHRNCRVVCKEWIRTMQNPETLVLAAGHLNMVVVSVEHSLRHSVNDTVQSMFLVSEFTHTSLAMISYAAAFMIISRPSDR